MAGALFELHMLIEGTSVEDVRQLRSTADGEHWHLETARLSQQCQLPLVTVGLDRTQVLVGLVSVARRFDVRSPLKISPSKRASTPSTSASRVNSTGSPPAAATEAG